MSENEINESGESAAPQARPEPRQRQPRAPRAQAEASRASEANSPSPPPQLGRTCAGDDGDRAIATTAESRIRAIGTDGQPAVRQRQSGRRRDRKQGQRPAARRRRGNQSQRNQPRQQRQGWRRRRIATAGGAIASRRRIELPTMTKNTVEPDNGPLIDLNDLKRKTAADLLALAETLGIQEGVARARKQDIVFFILKAHARAGGGIYGEGVLEILQDGFGFLRGPDAVLSRRPRRYLRQPAPDPPLQPAHRRLHHRTHPPAEGRRALLRAAQGRPHQRRAARGVQEQGPVREPDPAVSAQVVPSRARQRFHRGHHRPHPRPGRADRPRPARADRLASRRPARR